MMKVFSTFLRLLSFPESTIENVKRVGGYFRPHLWKILVSLLCSAVVGGTVGVSAWLVKPVLDDIFIKQDAWKLYVLPVVILLLYLVKGLSRFLQSYIMRWVGETVVLKIREDLVRSLAGKDLAFYDRNPTGILMALVTNDVAGMQRLIPDLMQMSRSVFTVAGLVTVLFARDWKLALVAMIVFPVAVVPLRRAGKLMRGYAHRGLVHIGEISNILQETFSGIEVVKSFRAEQREVERFLQKGEKLRRALLKYGKLSDAMAPVMEFVGAIGTAVIIWYGGSRVLRGEATPGEFFSFMTALLMLYDPLKRSGTFATSFYLAMACSERVFGFMDAPPAPCEVGGDRIMAKPIETVAYEDVRFSYDPAKGEVLRGVSFEARRGELIALVGPSGGGKSTVLKLLPRFYGPDGGRIAFNGIDSNEYTVSSLRGCVAVVTQDTFLFNDTVRANLTIGRPDATEEEMIAAAKAANAHAFIQALPQGYDTPVGERGDLLSGGQRQRMAIARAVLKDAPILILDEATSSLDSESEKEVQVALEKLMEGRTTFVIAHRLSTVRHADRILFLRDGQVLEMGTHGELLARSGEYARLCELQFGPLAVANHVGASA